MKVGEEAMGHRGVMQGDCLDRQRVIQDDCAHCFGKHVSIRKKRILILPSSASLARFWKVSSMAFVVVK